MRKRHGNRAEGGRGREPKMDNWMTELLKEPKRSLAMLSAERLQGVYLSGSSARLTSLSNAAPQLLFLLFAASLCIIGQ
jgi:hypothetical protein